MSPLPAALRARVPTVVDRVFVRPLPDNPKAAAMVSLHYINALVRDGARDPLVRQTAQRIVQAAGVAPGDRRGTITAIHDWIQGSMRYEHDPRGIEMLTEARKTLEAVAADGQYAEDCDGMVIAEAAMLRAQLGAPNVRHIILKGDKRSPTDWSHIFLQAHDGAAWVTLDPIMNGDAPERPKKPVGWHPPRYYGRAVVDPGASGPTWRSMAQRDGMAVYERGSDMNYDLIPAQRERGNAIAYEDDTWLERMPQFNGIGAVMSGDYAQQRGLPKRSGLGAVARVPAAEAALDNRAARAAQTSAPAPGLLQAATRHLAAFMRGGRDLNAPIVRAPRRGQRVPPGLYHAATGDMTRAVMAHSQLGPASGVVLAPLEGFGAILANRYAGGHIPGYRPTTVGEDPRTAENQAYWAGPGMVGGAMRSQAVKTQLYRGQPYASYGAQDATSVVASLAETIVTTGAQVATLQQLNELNKMRVKSGQPPLSTAQAGLSAPAALPFGVPLWLVGVGVAVAGAGVWASMRGRKARR